MSVTNVFQTAKASANNCYIANPQLLEPVTEPSLSILKNGCSIVSTCELYDLQFMRVLIFSGIKENLNMIEDLRNFNFAFSVCVCVIGVSISFWKTIDKEPTDHFISIYQKKVVIGQNNGLTRKPGQNAGSPKKIVWYPTSF